jgi:hypothetical protein
MQAGAGANNEDKPENCNKLPESLIQFNSVFVCPECFQKELQPMAARQIEP